jgi:hypothetical protein
MTVMWNRPDVDSRLRDMAALGSARDASELWRALVLAPPAAYEREPMMPVCYFTSVHDHDREGAVQTAMLLVTDRRWVPASGPLMTALEATGLIGVDELDLLAQTFVAAGPEVYWRCPDDWFTGPEIVIDLDGSVGEVPEPPDQDEPRTWSPGLSLPGPAAGRPIGW